MLDQAQIENKPFDLAKFIEALEDIENCIDGKVEDITSLTILKQNYSPTGFGAGLHRALTNDAVPQDIKQRVDRVISFITKKD